MASGLPVDILEDIFLCLDDVADLVRASAACTWFRRVVSDGRFLRRFRTVHRRPVLGLLLTNRGKTAVFCPAQRPQQSAQAAAGFAKAADFNLADFLPDRKRWCISDVHGGLLLLTRCPNYHGDIFEKLVVYDPLHRRHIQIPTIPSNLLLAAAMQQDGNDVAMTFDSPFLTRAVDDDDDDESLLRFQVTCIIAVSKAELVAFVFSSANGQWRRGASFHNPSYDWAELLGFFCRQHVHGCVCWARPSPNFMLVFDTHEMKFSIADLPRESFGMIKMAVEARDGSLGLLLLSNSNGCTKMDLYSKPWQEPKEWQHDSSVTITLPGFNFTMLAGAAEGYAILRVIPYDQYKMWIHTDKKPEVHYFTFEVKTLLVEKLCVLEFYEPQNSFLYASFPPLFFHQARMKL